jgi:cytidylate kinase
MGEKPVDEKSNLIARMRAITVSREYGSGGGEIARRLAKRLGWQLIDHEIVRRVAQELHVSIAQAEAHDERVESTVSYILKGVQAIHPTMLAVAPLPVSREVRNYHEALSKVVKAAVIAGHVVIVGRGSQALLAGERDVLHVRIVAPLEQRIRYVMQREAMNRDAAHARILLKDQDRARYLRVAHHRNPDDPYLYDLIVNTEVLDLDSAVDLIQLAAERKAARLTQPAEQLGPATGLPRYPGQPHDLPSPKDMTEPPNEKQ